MATTRRQEIAIEQVPPGTMLAEQEKRLLEFEAAHQMSSQEMANLLAQDAISSTPEVLRWYSTFCAVRLLRAKTHTTGIRGTTTETSTKTG